MQATAQAAYDEACARLAEGSDDREDVLNQYVSDEAFEIWYDGFIEGLKAAAGL